MKLHADIPSGSVHIVTHIGEGYVQVGEVRYTNHLVLSQDKIELGWAAHPVGQWQRADFEALVAWHPEVLLIGTGQHQHFPPLDMLRPLIEARIGFEIMDTARACHTYNILVGEGRQVVAALLLERSDS